MDEVYTFEARLAKRYPDELHIVPVDPAAFLAYLDRAHLTFNPYWHGPEIVVSVTNPRLVARCGATLRVLYSVVARDRPGGRKMYGIGLQHHP